MNIFRADDTNVGDWWSPPGRYFPFKPAPIFDILNSEKIPNENDLYKIRKNLIVEDARLLIDKLFNRKS